jgi:hypothetical protein
MTTNWFSRASISDLISLDILARVSPRDAILHDYGVHAYRVTKSTVDDWNFNISLAAATSNAESIQMRGRYNGFSGGCRIGEKEPHDQTVQAGDWSGGCGRRASGQTGVDSALTARGP